MEAKVEEKTTPVDAVEPNAAEEKTGEHVETSNSPEAPTPTTVEDGSNNRRCSSSSTSTDISTIPQQKPSPTDATVEAETEIVFSAPHTAEGVCNTKPERITELRQICEIRQRSYTSNSSKEDICLLYVDNFQRQFVSLFPGRRALFLTPQNEFGCEKVVCTTLRPTQLEYVELYDAERCAAFVKDFVVYEPLQDPCGPPQVLQSPSLTLQSQVGDSFDMSVLLCSYLLGAGHDAFCVFGYAQRKTTLLDQTEQVCDLVKEEEGADRVEEETIQSFKDKLLAQAERDLAEEEAKENADGTKGEQKVDAQDSTGGGEVPETHEEAEGGSGSVGTGGEGGMLEQDLEGQEVKAKERSNPYEVKSRGLKESSYLKLLEKEKALIKKYDEEKDDFDLDDFLSPAQQKDPQDPLQGQRVHCWVLVKAGSRGVKEDFFIEPSTGKTLSVFDSQYLGIESVWNNKNIWVNMQDLTSGLPTVSFDLADNDLWEYVFIEKDLKEMFEEKSMDHIGEDLPPTMLGGEEKSDSKQEEEGKQELKVLVLPPSWVDKLDVPRDVFSRRYGRTGQRVQLFHKCKVEEFAEFVNTQGLVRRVTRFKDAARTFPIERAETFKNRGDKLMARTRYPLQNKVVERFEEGQAYDLKEVHEVVGKSVALSFNSRARLDGLILRKEVFGVSIQDNYKDRDDRLIERKIMLGPVRSKEEEAKKKGRKNTTVLSRGKLGDFLVHKITEKFGQASSNEGKVGISKRSFNFENGTIKLLYHYSENGIARSSILFHKDTRIAPEITVEDNLPHSTKPGILAAEFQNCLEAERNAYQNVRDACREMDQILDQRKMEEQDIVLEKSVFDRAKEDTTEAELFEATNEDAQEGEVEQIDYLTPFLNEHAFAPTEHDQALKAKESCLKATKERLLERASIIQSRLDEENALLAKKQAAYQRTRDHVEGADEEYENFCSETMFRIQILEQRLAQHEENALVKYSELDKKLREDPRLAILKTQKPN